MFFSPTMTKSRRRSDLVVMKRLGAGAFGAVNLVEPGGPFWGPKGALGMGPNQLLKMTIYR